jgi:hypothetical protein
VRRAAGAAAALVIAAIAPAALALVTTGPAAASAAQPRAALPVSLAITSVRPGYLVPGRPVAVTGSVTNTSPDPITGMTIRLRSSGTAFGSRGALQGYADGTTIADFPVSGAVTSIHGTLAPHATARWSIRLRASQLGLSQFGVYPLAAEADNAAGTALVTDRTFLPFWPGQRKPVPAVRQHIAWIWPMIGQPQQSACRALLTNSLASSFGAGGRLSGLLAAGRSYAGSARLTWAIDPALLASAQAMSKPYRSGANAACTKSTRRPASQAARNWLDGLKAATAGQPVFVTPYAHVAALVHRSLNDDLTSALTAGRSVASRILGRNFSPAAGQAARPGGAPELASLAWPADGIADYGVLNSLAVRGIRTVVLDSTTMPPVVSQTFTPSAVTTIQSGVGTRLHVLLADDTITQLLGTASHGPAPPGESFAVAQRFLAETAMFAAERPALARSLVVAPPRRWDPPPGLASELLAETVSAPWLRPVSLAGLARADPGPGQVQRRLLQATSQDELGGTLLTKARQLDRSAAVLQGIQVAKDGALSTALMTADSSAWRGGGARARRAHALLGRISAYVSGQLSGVAIIEPGRVTLGGLSGTLPVSIANSLPYPVRVRLGVTVPGDGRITVRTPPSAVTVGARSEVTLKLHVRAATVGSTTIGLSLLTPDRVPLPGRPVALTVQATHFGTLALVIIGAALGVFVITSARRAFTRGRGDQAGPGPDEPAADGADNAVPPGAAERADNVGTDRADDKHPPEDPDEYASAPGRTDRR